MAYLAINMKLY